MHFDDTPRYLGAWMTIHGYSEKGHPLEAEFLARGLLGIGSGDWRDRDVQAALRWLEPAYKPIDLYEVISQRWDYQPVLLDPGHDWLTDISNYMIHPEESLSASFGIIRFPITLGPGKTHTLVVDYKQELSRVGRSVKFYGLVYIMEPARRWGRWDKTTIQVHVPNGWKKVAIRPGPSRVTKSKGLTTYTTEMPHRPYENLYVSVVP